MKNTDSEKMICGRIDGAQKLSGAVAGTIHMEGSLASAYTTHTQVYDGPYEVTPAIEAQALETRLKYMTDDVKIHAIPYFETAHPLGGKSVYIGGHIDIE